MQVSFGKAVKIEKFSCGHDNLKLNDGTTVTEKDIIDTMAFKESSVFDEKTSYKIGSFLREQMGLKPTEDFYYKEFYDNKYVFTGKDAERVKEIEKQADEKISDAHYSNTSEHTIGRTKLAVKKAEVKAEEQILKLCEKYNDGKRIAAISLRGNVNGILNRIEYFYQKGEHLNSKRNHGEMVIQ